jgi:hypothetical protein
VKGYVLKWQNAQVLHGCAVFRDPSAILCKVLQEDEICTVRAVESICKTKKSLDTLKTTAFEEFPTVKRVMGWIKHEGDSVTYQGVDLKRYDQFI